MRTAEVELQHVAGLLRGALERHRWARADGDIPRLRRLNRLVDGLTREVEYWQGRASHP